MSVNFKKVGPHLAPVPSLTYPYSDMEMILGHVCYHAIRPLDNHGDKNCNSPFAPRLAIGWVLSGSPPSSLGLPSHCFKCSVEYSSLVQQVESWYELESYGTIYQPIRLQHQKSRL